MAQTATIRMEQISRAKKLLQELPEKENRKTRPEAAKLLEKDFRKALKKGYSPEELRSLLKVRESLFRPISSSSFIRIPGKRM